MVGLDVLWLFALSLCAGVFAFVLAYRVQQRLSTGTRLRAEDDAGQAIFLFKGDRLLDASAAARLLLAASKHRGSDFGRFMNWAEPRFNGLRAELAQLRNSGAYHAISGRMELLAEWRSGTTRIIVREPTDLIDGITVDHLSELAREEEVTALRTVLDDAPLPIWSVDDGGQVVWANQAYVMLCAQRGDQPAEQPIWPLPALFPPVTAGKRASLLIGGEQLWYDCYTSSYDHISTHYALPAQAAVQAELALAAFMQTLTRTFSYLPVGLAMFDRQRRLHLFNPALTDLTRLPFDFLSARPTFNSFLDAMRDRGCIPEPQDYAAWRQRIAALDHRGEIENYEDVWPLSSGKSYRVSARPHPEGTLALLIHDITDEMTSTRALTAELRQMQSVVDASPEAMVVFSPLGEGVFCNESYRALWPDAVGVGIALPPLAQALRTWVEGCAPTSIWEEVEAYVAVPLSHQAQRHLLSLRDGRALGLRMVPLAGGATLISFAVQASGAVEGGVPPLARSGAL